jgi:hypothetical protein
MRRASLIPLAIYSELCFSQGAGSWASGGEVLIFLAAVVLIPVAALLLVLRKILPKDHVKVEQREMSAKLVVADALLELQETGSVSANCPLCQGPIEIRPGRSQEHLQTSCRCGSCDGEYSIAPVPASKGS